MSLAFFFSFLATGIAGTAPTVNAPSTLNTLLEKAAARKLHNERYWQVLMHYKAGGAGQASLIDDPKFFLARDGKTNPQGELTATLRAFFESRETGDHHPRCRFPGRFAWLKEQLEIDERAFADIRCGDFESKRKVSVQPRSLALVFPSFFMNNPASMFGHTLLRIDGAYESKLLAHSVNYAAHIDDSGFLYPFKGVLGFYKGYFKVFPYYEMIQEYGDIEQRDMWEYKLNLSEEEARRMFRHLWEMKDIYSYYYFFDENCSYNLLFLLEAARPDLKLTDSLGLWVIPVDTIRKVLEAGIVTDINFRSSVISRIQSLSRRLSDNAVRTAWDIVEGKRLPGEIRQRRLQEQEKIMDLAAEMVQYSFFKKRKSPQEYRRLYHAILKERSALGKTRDKPDDTSSPPPPRPEEGHHSSRLALGGGTRDGVLYQEIKYRPAYHGLEDPDRGYQEGAQIIFAEAAVRYYSGGPVRLAKLDLIDIVSLAPRDFIFKPLSWKVNTGFVEQTDRDGSEELSYQLNPGVGLSYQANALGLCYLLSELNLSLGRVYRDNYALGFGIQGGLIRTIAPFWKIHASGEALFYELGDSLQDYRLSLLQNFRISQNNGIEFGLTWKKAFHNAISDINVSWNLYF